MRFTCRNELSIRSKQTQLVEKVTGPTKRQALDPKNKTSWLNDMEPARHRDLPPHIQQHTHVFAVGVKVMKSGGS